MCLRRYSSESTPSAARRPQCAIRPQTWPAGCRSRASRPRRAVREHGVASPSTFEAGDTAAGNAPMPAATMPWPWGVSALIRESTRSCARLERCRPATHPRDDVRADVTRAVADERLSRVQSGLTRRPPDGGEVGAQQLIRRVLLVAEAAADMRLDDAYLAPGDAEPCPTTRRTMCGICVEVNDDAPGLHGGEAHVVFDVAMLHGRRVVPALDLDKARLAAGLLADCRCGWSCGRGCCSGIPRAAAGHRASWPPCTSGTKGYSSYSTRSAPAGPARRPRSPRRRRRCHRRKSAPTQDVSSRRSATS